MFVRRFTTNWWQLRLVAEENQGPISSPTSFKTSHDFLPPRDGLHAELEIKSLIVSKQKRLSEAHDTAHALQGLARLQDSVDGREGASLHSPQGPHERN